MYETYHPGKPTVRLSSKDPWAAIYDPQLFKMPDKKKILPMRLERTWLEIPAAQRSCSKFFELPPFWQNCPLPSRFQQRSMVWWMQILQLWELAKFHTKYMQKPAQAGNASKWAYRLSIIQQFRIVQGSFMIGMARLTNRRERERETWSFCEFQNFQAIQESPTVSENHWFCRPNSTLAFKVLWKFAAYLYSSWSCNNRCCCHNEPISSLISGRKFSNLQQRQHFPASNWLFTKKPT